MNKRPGIYFFKLSDAKKINSEDFFSSNERIRYEKLSSPKRRDEFLASRFLIKFVLQKFYGIEKPVVKVKKNGKPFMKGAHFNISHSGNIIVLAVHLSSEIGIDVEEKTAKASYLKIARQFFHQIENDYILAAKSQSQQMARFKMLWSLKEAYIKASGSILNRQSMQIYFDLKNQSIIKAPTKKDFQFFYNEKLNIAFAMHAKASADRPVVYQMRMLKNEIYRTEMRATHFKELAWQGIEKKL